MKHALRVLLILVTVVMLTVLSASVALAHDDNGSQGTDNAPVNPNDSLNDNPTDNDANGIAQQAEHNPTCKGHDN